METGNYLFFEQLFKTEYKPLCFFAFKYVKDLEIAREIVQEAFAGLWEKRETLDLNRNVKSYLTSAVHNRCLNYLRDTKKFNGNILNLENLDISDNPVTGDSLGLLIEAELHDKIEEAINELPDKCRAVFLLSKNENLKYREIAEQLNISVKTVEVHMSKALQHLRIRLAAFANSG